MSVVCALGEWIGSDTASICDGLITPCGPKWVLGKDWAIGVAGDLRTQTLIAEHPDLLDAAQPGAFAKRLRELFKDHDYASDATSGPQSFGSDLIISGVGGTYELCSALSLIKSEGFCAIGSGSRFALGAAFALGADDPEFTVKMAIEAAVHYDAGCNGGVWVHSLTFPS